MRRACLWLLETFLPADARDSVIGDLMEREDGSLRLARETLSALWHLGSIPRPNGAIMSTVGQDLRIAARMLRRAPSYTLTVVVTLGLAIGATAAIYSVVEPVLIKPLPYPDAGRLAIVWERDRDGSRDNVGFATYRDLATEAKTLEVSAAVGSWAPTIMPADGTPGIRVDGARVSWSYFRVLGVGPTLGRAFLPEEDTPDNARVVVLSDGLWRRVFGADASIVGRQISISGTPMTVVGVMPASFYNALDPDVQIWRVLGYDNQPWTCRTCHHLNMIARVRADRTMTDAERELSGIHQRLEREYPKEYASAGALVVGLQAEITREYRPALVAIAGAVLLMLLIAAANVVNLNLARAVRREQEFAVRVAVGAGRGRLTAQLLTEGLVIAVMGGAFGILVARVALPLLVARLPDQLPRLAAIHLDLGAFGVTGAIVLALAAAVGLTAGTKRAGAIAVALHAGTRVAGGGRRLTRRALVVVEVALAVMLLASATLLGRSLVRLLAVDPGFDPTHLLALEINSVGKRYATDASVYDYHEQVADAVRALPGVESVALANQLPMSGSVDMYGIMDPDNVPANPELVPNADRYSVSPAFFRAMRLPLKEGRLFTDAEARDTSNLVVVVSEGLARALWPGQSAIGHRITTGGITGRVRRVVGVVGSVKHHGLDADMSRQIYTIERQWEAESQETLVVRASGDPELLGPAIRRVVRAIDPSQPITWMVTMEQMIRRSTTQRRFALLLFGAFAIAALLLAAAGIYGVLSGAVAERTREIGVRTALGATPRDIVAMVLGDGGRMAGLGIALGIAGALLVTRFLRSLLYGIGATDPVTLVAVAVALAAVTVVACLLPARRAVAIDPSTALRAD